MASCRRCGVLPHRNVCTSPRNKLRRFYHGPVNVLALTVMRSPCQNGGQTVSRKPRSALLGQRTSMSILRLARLANHQLFRALVRFVPNCQNALPSCRFQSLDRCALLARGLWSRLLSRWRSCSRLLLFRSTKRPTDQRSSRASRCGSSLRCSFALAGVLVLVLVFGSRAVALSKPLDASSRSQVGAAVDAWKRMALSQSKPVGL